MIKDVYTFSLWIESFYVDMYFFLRGLPRKCFANFPCWIQLVETASGGVPLITDCYGYMPEAELPWVGPLEVASVLLHNFFFQHTDRL